MAAEPRVVPQRQAVAGKELRAIHRGGQVGGARIRQQPCRDERDRRQERKDMGPETQQRRQCRVARLNFT
jgi:hypothetical protein